MGKLDLAWSYPAGTGTLRFNPIVVDGTIYVLGANRAIVALDAATGRELWTHVNDGAVGDRGMNYWESKDRSDRRLLYMNGGFLTAIDARSGQSIPAFGTSGHVDVRIGLHRDVTSVRPLQTGNPGRIFENLIIMSLPAGGAAYVSNPGDVHAYDVRTGELKWTFHSVPEEGEAGADTWPEGFLTSGGGVHNWSELSVDEQRGIAYIPFGTARFDFYGGNRHGANVFGNSLVALDARTGKRLWHFQIVHHDLWDYDLPAAPKLLTVRHDGRNVDVVAQPTKQGFLFVFDRVTGAPLWPIEERPVPQTDVPGEQTWPTQPFPTAPPPFARQSFTEKDINPFIPEPEQAKLRELLRTSRNEGLFTPPSLQGSIELPGHNGGANWGSSAVDPTKGTMYIVNKNLPTLLKVVPPGRWGEGQEPRDGPCPLGRRARGWPTSPCRSSAKRRRGLRRVQLALRLPVPEQRAVGDRSAVVASDGVRPEQGHDSLADPGRRIPRARARKPRAAWRPGRDGRRVDLRGHLVGSKAARVRPGQRQGPLAARSSRGIRGRPGCVRGQRPSIRRDRRRRPWSVSDAGR